jgi:site-specific DNA-methyltransferase (adenine-specific)
VNSDQAGWSRTQNVPCSGGAAPEEPPPSAKQRSPKNRTLRPDAEEPGSPHRLEWEAGAAVPVEQLTNRLLCADTFSVLPLLPARFVDLLVLDPPYNLTKNYNGNVFRERSGAAYSDWFASLLTALQPALKPTASLYVCANWQTSLLIAPLLEQHFQLRNRITWAREKGRGSNTNWKSVGEDIWFCTNGSRFHFDVDAVKLRKKVRAPYRLEGRPKDWCEDGAGRFRITHPSNVWTDLTVPFWSMPENTRHPTQKPEKLVARLLLASSRPGDMVFDPFLGSGTTAVVAKKLGRNFFGIEKDPEYCAWGLQRLQHAGGGDPIQGYRGGVFWERNTRE